jgi:hypothetical protein
VILRFLIKVFALLPGHSFTKFSVFTQQLKLEGNVSVCLQSWPVRIVNCIPDTAFTSWDVLKDKTLSSKL